MEQLKDSVIVARSQDVVEGDRIVVAIDRTEVGVFRVGGDLYAYENICQHQGGPVCQGVLMSRVVEVLDDQKRSQGDAFSETEVHVVCPWHGYEYNVRTGEHPTDPKIRLKAFEVFERDGEVHVVL